MPNDMKYLQDFVFASFDKVFAGVAEHYAVNKNQMTNKPKNQKESVREWAMPSSTNPAKKYTVKMYTDSSMSCNCPRWTNKRPNQERTCPHIIGILSVLRLDQVDTIIKTEIAKPAVKRKITFVDGDR